MILEISQPEYALESNHIEIFTCALIFVCPNLFGILDPIIWPVIIDLRFDLSEPNLRTADFCLTSNTSENWWSDFIAIWLFKVTDVLIDTRLFSVIPSGVETRSTSRKYLYCCWLSHLTYFKNNFFKFSKNIF